MFSDNPSPALAPISKVRSRNEVLKHLLPKIFGIIGEEGQKLEDFAGCSVRVDGEVGDVPLFVEHCEAAVAEVDVTRRWLNEQGRHELSFSFDVLAERHGVPEVACAPSIVGSLLRLPPLPPRSSAGPSRPIAIASRCGCPDARCS